MWRGASSWPRRTTARSLAYFRGNAITGPLLVLAAWAVGGTLPTPAPSIFRKKGATPS
ncbi:hypothetical protein [Streptomyces tubercidicus]|uniref:hypothetical protein n=1 Tax=Streptomyces tubercidicus TaxID=47759 RepID=UPI00399BFBBC